MKKYSLAILSMLLLLSGCGHMEKEKQSSEVNAEKSEQQESTDTAASESMVSITDNKEVIIQGVMLDRDSNEAVYSDVIELLNKRYELLNEILSEWDSDTDSRDTISINLTGAYKSVMYRVKVSDSWEYYEEKAKIIYDDAYVEEVLPPIIWDIYMQKWMENYTGQRLTGLLGG